MASGFHRAVPAFISLVLAKRDDLKTSLSKRTRRFTIPKGTIVDGTGFEFDPGQLLWRPDPVWQKINQQHRGLFWSPWFAGPYDQWYELPELPFVCRYPCVGWKFRKCFFTLSTLQ